MKYVRDGKKVAPYCSKCGCRLNQVQIGNTIILMHFKNWFNHKQDARNHFCDDSHSEWQLHATKVYGAEVYSPNN